MKRKKCSECSAEKALNNFALASLGKFGRCSICKDCRNESLKKYRAELKITRPWKFVLDHIRRRCSWVKESSVSTDWKYYKSKGIKCCLSEDQVKELWLRDNALEMKKPHIDRLDSDKDYSFDNCRFLEGSEHIKISNRIRSLKKKEVTQ